MKKAFFTGNYLYARPLYARCYRHSCRILRIAKSFCKFRTHQRVRILSRFGVPAFFFLSAFGLFYHTSVEGPFSYKEFMHRRIQVVLFPYITWSIFYLLYTGVTAHNLGNLHPGPLAINLLFGTSMYHLYFMVILLWFYVMMPLWRAMVIVILKRPVFWLVLLFVIQVGIDYVSSYMLGRWVTENLSNQPVLKYLFDMRLNYWVIHYVWIFLLGAVCAERYEIVCEYMWRYRYLLGVSAVSSVLLMLGSYYYVMDVWHYTVLEAIYTVHQMSLWAFFIQDWERCLVYSYSKGYL